MHQQEKKKISFNDQLEQIFAASEINEEQKVLQIIKIRDIIIQPKTQDIQQNLNRSFFTTTNKNLDRCYKDSQRALLNLTEIISFKGVENSEYSIFYWDMRNSGLVQTVETLLLEENLPDQFKSQPIIERIIFVSFARIYICIMKGLQIKEELLILCTKILSDSISSLLNKLRSSNEQQQKDEMKLIQIRNDINGDTKEGIKTFQALSQASQTNIQYFIHQAKVHNIIAPLIHINCPLDLNCEKRIVCQQSPILQQLQSSFFQFLRGLLERNNEIQRLFIEENDIIQHLLSTIIYNTKDLQNNITIIQHSLQIFHDYLAYRQYAKLITITPELINTLLLLFNSIGSNNKNIHNNTSLLISERSFWCLDGILMYCGSDWIQYLLNSSYISGLTNWISLSGGSQIQSNLLIREGIVGIVVFFTRINDIDDTQLSFNLHKQFQEQNEYQGQSEEIEAHLFSIKYQGSKISIQEDAERTKRFLTMAYKWVFAI